MHGPKEFTAYKMPIAGELITISGTKEELLGGALSPILPLTPSDTFQLEISNSIDPQLIHNLIKFTTDEFAWEYDDPCGVTDLAPDDRGGNENSNWNVGDYYELASLEGETFRRAIVRGHATSWQVVGISAGQEVVTLLQGLDDRYSGSRYIPGAKSIASYWWHSDGPGPISWDGDHAIYEVAGYWLSTSGGDTPEPEKIDPIPSNPAHYLFEWLERKNAVTFFLLKELKPKWDSRSLVSRLEAALEEQSQFINLELGVSEVGILELVEQISKSSPEARPVAEILETNGHPKAEKLVKFIESQDDLYWTNTSLVEQLDEWDQLTDPEESR